MKFHIELIEDKNNVQKESFTNHLIDLLDIIKAMNENDVLYVYNEETSDQLEIAMQINNYYVCDLMKNGMFKIVCDYEIVVYILGQFSNINRDPALYGMESFG